ncbi:MAG: DGQHR domain-containing protein [Phycisphaerales bacterium]
MNNPKELKLTVLPVEQKIGTFYVASISARDLVEISYSDVRRLTEDQRDLERYLGIQRPVNPRRIKEIRKYLTASDATFPTAVIVAVDERCAVLGETERDGPTELILRPYDPEEDTDDQAIPYGKIARVIDGQHRLAAFLGEDDNYTFDFADESFEINLAIFIGADVSEQANIFATVNLAQTKVNKSLVYDLTDLAKARSPHKTCHDVAVVLDSESASPFYERIKRLGTRTPGRGYEPLTQAAFVESLIPFISSDPMQDRNLLLDGERLPRADDALLEKRPFRNLFIEKKDLDIAEILFNYFDAVRARWPESWNAPKDARNLLPRSNAFKAFMKFLRLDVYPSLVGTQFGSVPTKGDFDPYFDRIDVTDRDFTTKNFTAGSSGESTFLKMLRGQITLADMVEDD